MAQKPYAAMQALLKDQTATAAMIRSAAEDLAAAAHMFKQTQSTNKPHETPQDKSPYYTKKGYYGDPNGMRPRMEDDQVRRDLGDPAKGHRSGRGVSGVRSLLGKHLEGRVGVSSGSHFQPMFDAMDKHTGYLETKVDGSTHEHLLGDNGLDDALAGFRGRTIRSNALEAFSRGGMLEGARALPYVGEALMGAEAINAGTEFVGNQRQKNAQYQAIFGGSNVGTGFKNRFQEEGFKLGQRFSGGLTGGQATEAFRGVSALGYQGSQRSSDLNFISSNYKSMGMDVAQSLQLISQASKTLNQDLAGLKDGLSQVSQAAKSSGLSGVAARQQFSAYYTAVSNTTPGIGSATVATSLASMQQGLGRNLQDVQLSNLYNNQQSLALMGSALGMSTTQLQGQIDQGNQSVIAQGGDAMFARIFAPMMANTQLTAMIQQLAPKYANMAKGDRASAIATEIMASGQFGNIAIQAAAQVQAYMGQQVNPTQAMELLVNYALGNMNMTAQQATQNQSVQQNLTKMPKLHTAGKTRAYSSIQQSAGVAKGVDPVVDQALSSLGNQDVIVTTQGGQQRVVSMSEAAQDYRDQIAKGTALLANNPSQTVSQALGGKSETNYQGPNTTNAHEAKGATSKKSGLDNARGETVAAYNANRQNSLASSGQSGSVTIIPSPELSRLIGFQATGNVAIATQSAAVGLVPTPGQGG